MTLRFPCCAVALSLFAQACHRATPVPVDSQLGLRYRPQRLDSPYGHCALTDSAERTRTLEKILTKKLWPVEGGMLFESDGPGGYSIMLAAVGEHEAKVYNFESEQWLTDAKPSPLLRFHADALKQSLVEGVDPTAVHMACQFLSMVIDHRVATALDVDSSRLWHRGEDAQGSTNTLLGGLILGLIELDNGVEAYESQVYWQRWRRDHPHAL